MKSALTDCRKVNSVTSVSKSDIMVNLCHFAVGGKSSVVAVCYP